MTRSIAPETERLLGYIKGSSIGVTQNELNNWAMSEGINNPESICKQLLQDKVVRRDEGKRGHPDRFKATRQAWDQ